MNSAVKVIMNRDSISEKEAEQMIEDIAEDVLIAVEDGDYDAVEDILMNELGLEMDYIFDIVMYLM